MEENLRGLFKVPKHQLKKFREEKDKQRAEDLKARMEPEKLQNYSGDAAQVFDFFEEIAGKKVNRLAIEKHLFYWFDEGFQVPEMKLYIQAQKADDWYRSNPTMYTLAKLFPILGEERVNVVWDLLSYWQAQAERAESNKSKVFEGIQIERRECGHPQSLEAYRKNGVCLACRTSEVECIINPYEMMSVVETNELRELCHHFMRQNEESLLDYADRTYVKRVEVLKRNGLKPPRSSFKEMLKGI
jgi:hypothetical protein